MRSLVIARAWSAFLGLTDDPQGVFRKAEAEASRLVELDVGSAVGYAVRAFCVCLQLQYDRYADALSDAQRAHELNPNDTFVLFVLGSIQAMMGNAQDAIKSCLQVLRLSPLDRRIHFTYVVLAAACWLNGRYSEGLEWARRAQKGSQIALGRFAASVCLVGLGEIDQARAEFAAGLKMHPQYLQRILQGRVVYATQGDRERHINFVRIAAGLDDPSTAEERR